MHCTTVEVVFSPTLRASRATSRPMRHAMMAMKAANTGALTEADHEMAHLEHVVHAVDEDLRRDVELPRADHHAAGDAGDVADEHQQRQRDHERHEPRDDQHLDRREPERADGVDLLLHLHGADLRGEGGAGAAGDEDRAEDRRQLAAHRRGAMPSATKRFAP